MLTHVSRAVGVLLALVGLALAGVGLWFALALGGQGTAEFTAAPGTADPVLFTPDVLNRVDADVVVSATASKGARVWMAVANPSDADAVLGETPRVAVTGVAVREWQLLSTTAGSGEPAPLASAQLWRRVDSADSSLEMTISQANAPESLIVAADGGTLETVTMRIDDKRWFVEAVVAVLVGLFLLMAAAVLLWPRRQKLLASGGRYSPGAGAADDSPTIEIPEITDPKTEGEQR